MGEAKRRSTVVQLSPGNTSQAKDGETVSLIDMLVHEPERGKAANWDDLPEDYEEFLKMAKEKNLAMSFASFCTTFGLTTAELLAELQAGRLTAIGEHKGNQWKNIKLPLTGVVAWVMNMERSPLEQKVSTYLRKQAKQ